MTGYARPGWMICLGFLGTIIFAIVSPMYGYFIMKTMNEMNLGYAERLIAQETTRLTKIETEPEKTVMDRALIWCIIMIIGSIVIFISKAIGGIMLSKVSENITGKVRQDLYESILRKDIGWHDHRDNSAGIMTGTLASDVQLLNGVSSEGLGAQIEGFFAVMTGLVVGFILSWPLALVMLAMLPIFLICGAIQQKAD